MKYILILLCMIANNLLAQIPLLIVKYSTNDCVFCNTQLQSLKGIKGGNLYVVMHESNKNVEEINNTISEFADAENIKFIFSDSLYYLFDSSERSICYVAQNRSVLYKAYLKAIDRDQIVKALTSQTKSGEIDYPGHMFLAQTKSHLYIGGNNKYILKVNKLHLNSVEDTIFINLKELKPELFKVTYGAKYLEEVDSFREISKREQIPNTFGVYGIQANGDSLWVMVETDLILKINGDLHIRNKPYLISFYKHQRTGIYQLDKTPLKNADSVYRITENKFYVYNGVVYLSVDKEELSAANRIYASCHLSDNKALIDKVLPLSLSDHLVTSKIGYLMSTGLAADGIISSEYSDDLYDLSTQQLVTLPIHHMKNTFTLAEANDLKFKVDFAVHKFSLNDDDLSVIYNSGDSLINTHFKYDRKTIKLTSSKLLSYPFPDKEKYTNYAVMCDKDGIYCYNRKNRGFNFYPYE